MYRAFRARRERKARACPHIYTAACPRTFSLSRMRHRVFSLCVIHDTASRGLRANSLTDPAAQNFFCSPWSLVLPLLRFGAYTPVVYSRPIAAQGRGACDGAWADCRVRGRGAETRARVAQGEGGGRAGAAGETNKRGGRWGRGTEGRLGVMGARDGATRRERERDEQWSVVSSRVAVRRESCADDRGGCTSDSERDMHGRAAGPHVVNVRLAGAPVHDRGRTRCAIFAGGERMQMCKYSAASRGRLEIEVEQLRLGGMLCAITDADWAERACGLCAAGHNTQGVRGMYSDELDQRNEPSG